ncbi:MAG: M48 family metalloprotease [Kordiimonadaceae bacterium]|nr:M48 family metalloprotease [Kordiimonadaceae bacterium]
MLKATYQTIFRGSRYAAVLSASLCIAVSFPVASYMSSGLVDQQDQPFEAVDEEKKKKKKKVKPSLLDKTKWAKKNYNTFLRRRKNNNLPAKLALAPFNVLVTDPTLDAADISGYIENPAARDVLLSALKELGAPIPVTLPDINIMFSGSSSTNASASSTGQIILEAGVAEDLRTMDSVMFLLGHELSHIALDHFKNEETRASLNTLATIAVFAANKGDVQKTQNSKELVGILAFSDKIAGPAWKKSDETRSDELAIDLMIRAGYSTKGAKDVVRLLLEGEKESEALRRARCGASGGLLSVIGLSSKPVKPECNVFNNFLSKIFGGGHPSASKRLKAIDAYLETRYPDYEEKATRELPEGLNAFFDPAGAFVRSAYAQKALLAFEEGNNELGIRYTVLSYDPDDIQTPGPRLARYQQLVIQGKPKEALEEIEIVYRAGSASRAIYLILMNEKMNEALTFGIMEDAQALENAAIEAEKLFEKDPDVLRAEAKALEKEAFAKKVANQTATPTFALETVDLTEGSIGKYDDVLTLIGEAKARFPGKKSEFLYKELEVLRLLTREDDLYNTALSCEKDKAKQLAKTCKGIVKEIKKLRKKRK